MITPDPLKQITCLYHFTDTRNLPLIRQHGGLYPFSHLQRQGVEIPAAGGNEWSREADELKGVGKYVHLCFRSEHPMEYQARQGGRIIESIFLQIEPAVLYWPDVKYTSDVSNKSGVPIHSVDEARAMIDYAVICTRTDWKDPEIQTRLKAAAKCELLVPRCIPLALIRNIPNG
jgi:hypothetical protein